MYVVCNSQHSFRIHLNITDPLELSMANGNAYL